MHVNITCLMKIAIFQKENNFFRKYCFTFVQVYFMFISLEDSVFNLFQYFVYVEIYEENLASHRYIIGKGRRF